MVKAFSLTFARMVPDLSFVQFGGPPAKSLAVSQLMHRIISSIEFWSSYAPYRETCDGQKRTPH